MRLSRYGMSLLTMCHCVACLHVFSSRRYDLLTRACIHSSQAPNTQVYFTDQGVWYVGNVARIKKSSVQISFFDGVCVCEDRYMTRDRERERSERERERERVRVSEPSGRE